MRNIHDTIRRDLDSQDVGQSLSAAGLVSKTLKYAFDLGTAATSVDMAAAVSEPVLYHVAVPIWYTHSAYFRTDMAEIIASKPLRELPLVPHSAGPEVRQTPGGSFGPKPDDVITYLIDQYRYFNSLAIQGAQNIVDAGFGALEAVLSSNPVLSTNPVVADARAKIASAHESFDEWCAYAREYNDWAFDKLENWVYNDVAPVINQAGESISDWYHKKILGH